jgi:hypothetical protein
LALLLHWSPAVRHPRWVTEVGDKVRFSISDVFLPNPEGGFSAAPGEEEVEGTVVNFSDSGSKVHVFAVVDVIRRHTVVVPVEKLRKVETPRKYGMS